MKRFCSGIRQRLEGNYWTPNSGGEQLPFQFTINNVVMFLESTMLTSGTSALSSVTQLLMPLTSNGAAL